MREGQPADFRGSSGSRSGLEWQRHVGGLQENPMVSLTFKPLA